MKDLYSRREGPRSRPDAEEKLSSVHVVPQTARSRDRSKISEAWDLRWVVSRTRSSRCWTKTKLWWSTHAWSPPPWFPRSLRTSLLTSQWKVVPVKTGRAVRHQECWHSRILITRRKVSPSWLVPWLQWLETPPTLRSQPLREELLQEMRPSPVS